MLNTIGFFDEIFINAKENSVIIMDRKGTILEVNHSFLAAFGYRESHLKGKNFSVLFTEKDQAANKPGMEVKTAISKGAKSDNNYLVHKDGTPIWVMGESIAVKNNDGEKFLVKIIQNINTQKKLERILLESNEFLDTIFDSVKDAGFLIVNSELRVIKCNKAFQKMFELKKGPVTETKLSQIENPFWKNADLKKMLTDVIVSGKGMKNIKFSFKTSAGREKNIEITSKLMDSAMERSILLVIRIV